MKVCGKCKEEKPKKDFQVRRGSRDGLQSYCRRCSAEARNINRRNNLDRERAREQLYREANRKKINEYNKRWIKNDPEAYKESRERFKEKHPGRSNEYTNKWRAANPEKQHAMQLDWQKRNPDKVAEGSARRRARKRDQMGPNPPTISDLWEKQAGRCEYCHKDLTETKYHLEHMVPFARGGLHDESNTCLSCPDCNMEKGIMTATEFLAKRLSERK